MSRRFRRLIPSPAMIVALVALVISLGSSAYALTEITSQQIDKRLADRRGYQGPLAARTRPRKELCRQGRHQ